MSAKKTLQVTKTKTALKQETYTLQSASGLLSDPKHDLKHDPHCQCGYVELGASVSVSLNLLATSTIMIMIDSEYITLKSPP
jgi:hypothetical protein